MCKKWVEREDNYVKHMLEQFLHLGAAADLSSLCLETITVLHNLFPKFNFYTSKHKSLILKYKEAKI